VLVCIGVVDVDALDTAVFDQAAPRGVREDVEEVVVLDRQALPDLAMRSRRQRCLGDPKTQRGSLSGSKS
jgi:hypothetical protein